MRRLIWKLRQLMGIWEMHRDRKRLSCFDRHVRENHTIPPKRDRRR